jgi:segregation and condensation protein B
MEEKDVTAPGNPVSGASSDQTGEAASREPEAVVRDVPHQEPAPDADAAFVAAEEEGPPEGHDVEAPVAIVDVPDQERTPDADAAFVAAEEEGPSRDEEPPQSVTIDEILSGEYAGETAQGEAETEEARQLAILEAIVYVTDEPLSAEQIARAMNQPLPEVLRLLDKLVAEYNKPEHGLTVKEVAGGYKMATKAEHHEAVRTFVKNLNPPLKLSLAALETIAVIAYKQPITAPEIMEIRGVQGAGVLKTLIDRKLITTAGRKNVVGKPILYKTTKEFLVQFGLRDLSELPTLKEFEDLRRMAFSDTEEDSVQAAAPEPEEQPEKTE